MDISNDFKLPLLRSPPTAVNANSNLSDAEMKNLKLILTLFFLSQFSSNPSEILLILYLQCNQKPIYRHI